MDYRHCLTAAQARHRTHTFDPLPVAPGLPNLHVHPPTWEQLSRMPRLGTEAYIDAVVIAVVASHPSWADHSDWESVARLIIKPVHYAIFSQLRFTVYTKLNDGDDHLHALCAGDCVAYRRRLATCDTTYADLRLHAVIASHPSWFGLPDAAGRVACAAHAANAAKLYSHATHAHAGPTARRAIRALTMSIAVAAMRSAERPVLPPELIIAVAQFIKPWTTSSERAQSV
jgi:hypothetical protein